jgi:hypothetical protein
MERIQIGRPSMQPSKLIDLSRTASYKPNKLAASAKSKRQIYDNRVV